MTATPPFQAGERVRPSQLQGWSYSGLSGVPDKDPDARRRYRKGDWVLELRALSDQRRPALVLSIRTAEEDRRWWQEERIRRLNLAKS